MDNKSDVKAILARFQSEATPMEGSNRPHPKNALHSTLSGPTGGFKKSALEASLSNASNTFPKPSYLKNAKSEVSAKNLLVSKFENASANAKEDVKPPFGKPFKLNSPDVNAKEDVKPPFGKPFKLNSPDVNQDGEAAKPLFPKPALQKPSVGSSAPEAKVTFPKPSPAFMKPALNDKAEKNETTVSGNTTANATPKIQTGPKPKTTTPMFRQQKDNNKEEEPAVKPVPSPISGSTVKPSSFRAAQNLFNKAEEATNDAKTPTLKEPPSVTRKPSHKAKPTVPDDPSAPKKKALPNIFALGSPPSKPNRPPRVNIEKFKKEAEAQAEGAEVKKKEPPAPPASHPSSLAAPDPPPNLPPTLPPCLPPRTTGPMVHEEEYDDVGDVNDSSFSGTSGHQFEDGEEMYEDLDWCVAEAKQQDRKSEKEEKKQAELEKKEQKERDKKEQDARKKFKLSGQIQIIHKVKARVDCKGGRTDLSFKQGDSLDIIRITENPEGRWLARSQDGSFGYVKTESVQIDFDLLKNQGRNLPPSSGGDIYDDVGTQEEMNRSNAGPGVVLPPLPDNDVYDDLDDSNLNISPEYRLVPKPRSFLRMIKGSSDWRKSPVSTLEVPPPPQFSPEGNAAPVSEELYDDVAGFPTPPPISSIPKPLPKLDDPKKQKKFEKEEKEFRKKFKFEGEIMILNTVTVINSKKGSGKDLTVQAGEDLDVISNSDADKFICRNKEGKFGYVLKSNIQSEEIYDDIGDDSIYDND